MQIFECVCIYNIQKSWGRGKTEQIETGVELGNKLAGERGLWLDVREKYN